MGLLAGSQRSCAGYSPLLLWWWWYCQLEKVVVLRVWQGRVARRRASCRLVSKLPYERGEKGQ